MTTYYIELFQFSNDADISKISTNTLKEVINDFTKELNKRCTEQNLNKHLVMQAEVSGSAEAEQLPREGLAMRGTASMPEALLRARQLLPTKKSLFSCV